MGFWHRRPVPLETPFEQLAGAAYQGLVEAELRDERARKRSIEKRGLAVVQTTAVILGILVGVVPILTTLRSAMPVLATGATALPAAGVSSAPLASAAGGLPSESLAFVAFGALAFVSALVSGIIANAPITYDVAKTAGLRRLTEERFWRGSRTLGSRRATEVRLDELQAARNSNRRKSWWLRVAFLMEALGIVCVGAAALVALVMNVRAVP